MTTFYRIREAQPIPADAAALLSVERVTLNDSPYDPAALALVMRRSEHHAYLATAEDTVVGFCSCFDTLVAGETQVEIDLLGVHPDHQGRGIATRLIKHAIEQARRRGVARARAAIAVDNAPSLGAFGRAGFDVAGLPHRLMIFVLTPGGQVPGLAEHTQAIVSSKAPGAVTRVDVVIPERLTLLSHGRELVSLDFFEVHTLSYAGLWLEHLQASTSEGERLAVRALCRLAKARELDEVGHLMPPKLDGLRLSLVREGLQEIGKYKVATRQL